MTVEISAVGGAGHRLADVAARRRRCSASKVGDSVDVQAPKGAWQATIKRIH